MSRSLLVLAVAACSAPPASHPSSRTATPPPAPSGTRLVVLLVIDQLPEWAFEQKRPALTGGFDRLLAEGVWHVGQHPSVATLTAPGHALLGTGEPSATSGILTNGWWHRDVGRVLKSVEDEDGKPTAKWLRVPGLGDAIAAANTGAKAVAVSLKDRAAILPLGHAGTSIWYDHKRVAWTSLAPVPWLDDWNRAHPVAAHLHDVWTPLDAGKLATLSGTIDAQPGEAGDKGFGPTFPHELAATKDPASAILAAPIGNELVFDMAGAAIDAEQLGADDIPDLLVLSLSAYDYVGHGWGHESWESWDMTIRLDARLGQFLDELDRKVGAGHWSMIATSDHGASPMPERSQHGGRLVYESIKDAANRAAIAELGPGDWVADAKYPSVYLTAAANAQPKKDREAALKKIVLALRSFPGIERVGRTADFAGHCEARTGDAFTICLGLDPERSGEIFYLPAEGWIHAEADEHDATAHGSLHAYDRLVPVIMLEPGRTKHAPQTAPDATQIQMVRISALLARWLGVTPPASLPR